MILVSGGTGYVGRALVQRLAARGDRVRVLTRRADEATLPPGVELARGDLSASEPPIEALRGVRSVVHLAAALPAEHVASSELERVNVAGTRTLAAAAAACGVRRFVHVSSAGVYGDSATLAPRTEDDVPAPRTAYERSKLEGEHALRAALEQSDVRWTILRPTGVFGAGRPATAALFREVAHRRIWLHGAARVIVHPLYVADLAEAIARCLADERVSGEVINLGGDRAVEYRELLTLIGSYVGRAPLHLSAPRWSGAIARALVRGAAGRSVVAGSGRLARLAAPLVNRSVSIEKARRSLAFVPTALERGLETTARELASTPAR